MPSSFMFTFDYEAVGLIVTLFTIVTSWYLFSRLNDASKSTDKHRKARGFIGGYSKAYRVRFIPPDCDEKMTANLLKNAWGLDDDVIKIKSLAVDAVHPSTKVATIEVPAEVVGQFLLPVNDSAHNDSRHLTLDDNFFGITTLASPPRESHMVDIIALSGLSGHAFGSFKQKGGNFMWLRDAIPVDIPEARVLTYGYDTRLLKSQSVQDLEALGEAFANFLQIVYKGESKRIPKVIIGHSLGGLVLKQTFILLRKWEKHDLLETTRAILLFGVPSQGMETEALISMIEGQPNASLVRMLEHDSQLLRHLSDGFTAAVSPDTKVFCYYETKRSPTVRKISVRTTITQYLRIQPPHEIWKRDGPYKLMVSGSSARHDHSGDIGENVDSIDETHSDMVKFARGDTNYTRVMARLCELAKSEFKSNIRSLTRHEKDFLQTLSFPQMNSRRNDIAQPSDQTCQWIFDHPEFQKWSETRTGLLCIRGNPGAGKSTLLKHIVERFETINHPRTILLTFFFHGRGADLEKTPSGLYQSLLHQLCLQVPDAFSKLVNEYTKREKTMGSYGEKWTWHVNELRVGFEDALAIALQRHSIQIFVDALDECGKEAEAELVDIFINICQRWAGHKFSICFTCRHFPDITLDYGAQISTDEKIQADIETFVGKEIAKLNTDKKDNIRYKICQGARGIFQWAVLVTKVTVELKAKGKSANAIMKSIDKIPPDLQDLYQSLFNTFNDDDRKEALRLMRWICFSLRPLTLDEIRIALVYQTDSPPQSFEACKNRDDYTESAKDMRIKLNHLSRGLAQVIDIDGKDTVQFIHQSVQDFFQSNQLTIQGCPKLSLEDIASSSHFVLADACLNFIAMEDFQIPPEAYSGLMSSEFPFLHYSLESWPHHLKVCHDIQPSLSSPLVQLCYKLEPLTERWLQLARHFDMFLRLNEGVSIMHILCRYDLAKLIFYKPLNNFHEVNGCDKDSSTPVMCAAQNGHETTVRMLLDTGRVNPDSQDNDGMTSLSWATVNGSKEVVRMLLDTGRVNPDSQDNDGMTSLSWAAINSSEAVVRMLLDTGRVNINHQDKDGKTPLSWAAEYGSEAVVRMLLDTGCVDPSSQDNKGRTPLSWAAEKNHTAIEQILQDAIDKQLAMEKEALLGQPDA